MDRQEIMENLANWFGIEPNENGEYNINDYDWTSGCYIDRDHWFSLAEVVKCIESFV